MTSTDEDSLVKTPKATQDHRSMKQNHSELSIGILCKYYPRGSKNQTKTLLHISLETKESF